ncbi:MAG: cyclic pyranopterin monophosphate synthase MoaC [Aureliella sp.]
MGDHQKGSRAETGSLTHLDEAGAAKMVDVGEKPMSRRTASARAICRMSAPTAKSIRDVTSKKGDVLPVARIAAIGAAKRTDELIPLCHGIPIESVNVDFFWLGDTELEIRVTSACSGKTGVEMEAMVGASIAALTVYDMCKAMDRGMQISSVELLSKTGGSRGDYFRNEQTHD